MALFDELASAALAKGLPTFHKWLQARLGDDAEVGAARMEGARVVVERARLPLGPRIRLEVERASLAVAAQGLGTPRFHLCDAFGRVVVKGAGRELTGKLHLREGKQHGDPWLAGKLEIGALAVSGDALDGTLDVTVTAERWELAGMLGKQRVQASGAIGKGDAVRSLRVDLNDVTLAALSEHASAWLDTELVVEGLDGAARGRGDLLWNRGKLTSRTTWSAVRFGEHEIPSPLGAVVSLAFEGGRARGEVKLDTPRSNVELSEIEHENARFERATISGEVALADLLHASVFPDVLRPSARGDAQLELKLSGGASDWNVTGTVELDAFELEVAGLTQARLALESGQLTVDADRTRLQVTEFVLDGYGSRFTGQSEVKAPPFERPLLVMSFVDADVELVRTLAAMTPFRFDVAPEQGVRPRGARWLQRDLKLSGELSVTGDGEIHSQLALESADTALMMPLTFAGGDVKGTQLRGRLGTRDLLGLGFFDGPMTVRPEGRWTVNANLSGAPSSLRLQGSAETESTTLNLWSLLDLPLEEVSAEMLIDSESVVVRGAKARLFGGSIDVEGVIGFTDAFRGFDCQLSCAGVRAGSLVLPTGAISEHVDGKLEGRLHVRQLEGQGHLRRRRRATRRAALSRGPPCAPAALRRGLARATRARRRAAHRQCLSRREHGHAARRRGRARRHQHPRRGVPGLRRKPQRQRHISLSWHLPQEEPAVRDPRRHRRRHHRAHRDPRHARQARVRSQRG